MLPQNLINDLETIVTEAQVSIGGFKAGVWNWGGPEGLTITRIGDNISYNMGADAEEALRVGGGIAAAAVIALALVSISHSIYKNYINKWGRKCRGYKGVDRDNCIRRVKVKAVEVRMKALNDAKDKCKLSKDTQQCITKINSQLEKLNRRKEIMQASLMKVKKGA